MTPVPGDPAAQPGFLSPNVRHLLIAVHDAEHQIMPSACLGVEGPTYVVDGPLVFDSGGALGDQKLADVFSPRLEEKPAVGTHGANLGELVVHHHAPVCPHAQEHAFDGLLDRAIRVVPTGDPKAVAAAHRPCGIATRPCASNRLLLQPLRLPGPILRGHRIHGFDGCRGVREFRTFERSRVDPRGLNLRRRHRGLRGRNWFLDRDRCLDRNRMCHRDGNARRSKDDHGDGRASDAGARSLAVQNGHDPSLQLRGFHEGEREDVRRRAVGRRH